MSQTNKTQQLFCKKFTMEKGVTFLFGMDIVGAFLYVINMIGVIYGLYSSSSFGGPNGFYLMASTRYPIVTDLNAIVLAHSSLIIALVSIPRLFSFWHIKDEPEELFRRQPYFVVRAVTCVLLISLQIVAFVSLIYFIVQSLQTLTESEQNEILDKKLVPLIIFYGFALFCTIGIDTYWTIQIFHYHKDGKKEQQKIILTNSHQSESERTGIVNTSNENGARQIAYHRKSTTQISLTTTQDGAGFKQGQSAEDGHVTPSIVNDGWSSSGLTTPKKEEKEQPPVEKEGWDESSRGLQTQAPTPTITTQNKQNNTLVVPTQATANPSIKQRPPQAAITLTKADRKQEQAAANKLSAPVPTVSTEVTQNDRAPSPPMETTLQDQNQSSTASLPKPKEESVSKSPTDSGAKLPTDFTSKLPKAAQASTKRPEEEATELLIDKCIEEIWRKHDKEKNGFLNKKETREFVWVTLAVLQEGERFSEKDFNDMFKEFDKNKSGNISKRELKAFIKKLLQTK